MQGQGMIDDARKQWGNVVIDAVDESDDNLRKLAVHLASLKAMRRMALSTSDLPPQVLVLWTVLELLFPEVRHPAFHVSMCW